MENKGLDFTYFCPEVYQVVAGENYTVYAYINDGSIRLVDMKPMLKSGGVFEQIRDEKIFRDTLTVIGGTIAWDIAGNRNEYECIDICPDMVFSCETVSDIPEI